MARPDDRARPDEMRIGDAERDAVMVALHDHFAAGRLERHELDERLDAVLSARTRGDLRALVRDLPEPTGLPEPAEPAARPGPATPAAPPRAWGPGAAVMFGGPGHPAWHHHGHLHRGRHGHLVRGPHRRTAVFPLMLVVFLAVTFTVGPGAGVLAVLQLALVVWIVRAATLALGARRSRGSA